MWSWGEQCQRGFRLRDGSYVSEEISKNGVCFLDLGFDIPQLSAGLKVLSFVKTNGNAFIIRTYDSQDGTGVRAKQKCVECKEKIAAVSCTDDAVMLLSKKGRLLCVRPTHGKGNPRPLEILRGVSVSQVSCGSQHSIALTKDNQVFTWGVNSRGQLGLGSSLCAASSPEQVCSLSDVPLVQVAAGGEQSFCLSVSGAVFSWGSNSCGQLGLGDTADRQSPVVVQDLNMKKTCFISCGHMHTAVLTKDGAVFTFGSGRYGQLGHNSFKDKLRPQLIAELWGSKVTQVACGRHHTVVLTESQRIFSFGCGGEGQLGHGEESHPAVPLPVVLPPELSSQLKVNKIFAGANCSFATCLSADIETKSDIRTWERQPCLENLIHKWTSDSEPWKNTKQEIFRTFSSISCLNRSFLEHRRDKHFATSLMYCGLDLLAVQRCFTSLLNKDKILGQVEGAVMSLLPFLNPSPVGGEALRVYLVLTELLVVVYKHNIKTELAKKLADAIQSLSPDSQQVLRAWWSSLSYCARERHAEMWRDALSESLLCISPLYDNKNLVLVLEELYNINTKMTADEKLPDTTFSITLSETFLQQDVSLWRSSQTKKRYSTTPLLLCNYHFLMDLQSKKKAFDLDSYSTQEQHQAPPLMQYDWLFRPLYLSQSDFFRLKLKRASLVEDTFQQLSSCSVKELKKRLIVHFDGDSKITQVYKRDLFHHVFLELVSADSEMLVFNESQTLAWFPSRISKRKKKQFFLFGKLCGLALYNQCIIYLPFPLALFKKLLGVKASLDDLIELSPSVGNSLQYILDYEEDLQDMDMYFSIDWDKTEVELDPQHPGKPVTNDNKKEFVDAYVNHVFNTSVERAFQEFRRGFFQVCNQYAVELFKPDELRGVMVGSEIYDWTTFKQKTVYEPMNLSKQPTIQMFWEVFDELNEEQKKDFIWFLTGHRRVPISGLGQIQMKIREKLVFYGCTDEHFPESLTCHCILYLPLYSSKDVMRKRLTEAIIPERGFR